MENLDSKTLRACIKMIREQRKAVRKLKDETIKTKREKDIMRYYYEAGLADAAVTIAEELDAKSRSDFPPYVEREMAWWMKKYAVSLPADAVKVGEIFETDRGEKLECVGFKEDGEAIFNFVDE